MKKTKIYSRFITVLSIAVGISFAISYGYYNKVVAKEQTRTSVSINNEATSLLKSILIDTRDEGVPKKILQPTYCIIRYELKNDGKEAVTIKVDAINFKNEVLLESGAPGLQKPSTEYITTVQPGKSVGLKVRIHLSNIDLDDSKQYLGLIHVINQQTGLGLGYTPVYAINSTIPTPPQKSASLPTLHDNHTKN